MMWIKSLALAAACTMTSVSHAETFYSMVEPDGTIHIAKRRLSGEYRLMLSGAHVLIKASLQVRTGLRASLRGLITKHAQEAGVAVELVDAIILAESSYDPGAVSDKGAVGLMQLMPATAARFGVKDRSDPSENIRGGIAYLRWLLDRYGKVDLAIAAFNAGEGAVDRAGGIPPYAETRNYVAKVLAILSRGM